MILVGGVAWLAAGSIGCTERPQSVTTQAPQVIQSGEECHVCGMIVANYPGPKGQAFVKGRESSLKFCSTRDLFAWLLQPETAAVVQSIYVHDMGGADWKHPADNRFVEARQAWYVVDQPMTGAMGPTLATFAQEADAQAFAAQHGGRLVRFAEIDLDLITNLGRGTGQSPAAMSHGH